MSTPTGRGRSRALPVLEPRPAGRSGASIPRMPGTVLWSALSRRTQPRRKALPMSWRGSGSATGMDRGSDGGDAATMDAEQEQLLLIY